MSSVLFLALSLRLMESLFLEAREADDKATKERLQRTKTRRTVVTLAIISIASSQAA
jgi:hypothetical protein